MATELVNGATYREGSEDDPYSYILEYRDGVLFHIGPFCEVEYPRYRVRDGKFFHHFTRRYMGDVEGLQRIN